MCADRERATGVQTGYKELLQKSSCFRKVVMRGEGGGLTREVRDLNAILNNVTSEPYVSLLAGLVDGPYLSICLSAIGVNACVVQIQPVSRLSPRAAVRGHKEVGGAVRCFLPAAGTPAHSKKVFS